MSALRPALVFCLVFSVVCGVAYPCFVTAVAQLAFPHQANGSLLLVDGRPVASELVGQSFRRADLFWSRPSATGVPYDGASSAGSNLGPTSAVLRAKVEARLTGFEGLVPVELVTSSASGLDPHLSLGAALFQVRRVAAARGLDEGELRRRVEAASHPTPFGAPIVNVALLNHAIMKEPRMR